MGYASHAEGLRTIARGYRAHTEGQDTCILSTGGHAQGMANYHTNDLNVIHDIGIGTVVDSTDTDGTPTVTRLSAEATLHTEDVRNGYKYLIGVGGYKGQEIDNASSVQEVIANLADKIHTKVTKKRPYGQIVIGRSINPMSYGWGTIYCFRSNPSITIWSDNEEETFNVHIDNKVISQKTSGEIRVGMVTRKYCHTIFLKVDYSNPCAYCMRAEFIRGNTDIYLSEVMTMNGAEVRTANNLTGTSKRYSWNNGNNVTNRKGTFEQACNVLYMKMRDEPYNGKLYKRSYKINTDTVAVPYYMHRVNRGSRFRKKNPDLKCWHTKFTRKKYLEGGLYLVRFWDCKRRIHMNDVKVYVRIGAKGPILSRT